MQKALLLAALTKLCTAKPLGRNSPGLPCLLQSQNFIICALFPGLP